jgi:hypothetical protein
MTPQALTGEVVALTIGHAPLTIGGRAAHAIGVNATVPGPLIRQVQAYRISRPVFGCVTP